MSSDIPLADKKVTGLLRSNGRMSVSDLVDAMGITATAVRQKLNRLTASGLVARTDDSSGRGRPVHMYSLTEKGIRSSGNNLDDLARVLWEELHRISDNKIRNQVFEAVVERLTTMYRDSITGKSPEDRLRSIASLFAQKEIPFETKVENGKTVLQIIGCPYPDLKDADDSICEMEKRLLSGLIDQEVSVEQSGCGANGSCCTFQTVASDQMEAKCESDKCDETDTKVRTGMVAASSSLTEHRDGVS